MQSHLSSTVMFRVRSVSASAATQRSSSPRRSSSAELTQASSSRLRDSASSLHTHAVQ